jgi:hypothetical protein
MSWNPVADVPLKQMYLLAVFENSMKNIKPISTFHLPKKRVIMPHSL